MDLILLLFLIVLVALVLIIIIVHLYVVIEKTRQSRIYKNGSIYKDLGAMVVSSPV